MAANLFWEILEPMVREPERRERKRRSPPKTAAAPRPRKEEPPEQVPADQVSSSGMIIPSFQEAQISPAGKQLFELRGYGGFQATLLVGREHAFNTFQWPAILALPNVFPGSLLNTQVFLVQNPSRLEPRRFQFLKQLTWEKIFMEVRV